MWSFLLNPKVILGLMVAGFLAFFVFTMQENGRLKTDIKNIKQYNAQLTQAFETEKKLNDGDRLRLDKLYLGKARVVQKEQDLEDATRNIPVTLNDRPFQDPNNLAYANTIRQSQLDRMGPDE